MKPSPQNHVCEIHHGLHKLPPMISVGRSVGVRSKSKPYFFWPDTLVRSQKVSQLQTP